MKTRYWEILKGQAVGLAAAALLFPAVGGAYPTDTDTYQVNAMRVASVDFDDPASPANNPSHPAWAGAPETVVPLMYHVFASFNALNLIDGETLETPRNLHIKALHDGTRLAFRVVWADATQNPDNVDVPRFFDAIALMVPFQGADYPACVPGPAQPHMVHMGNRCNEAGVDCCPVQIMYWRPDKFEVENIVTNGPATTRETDDTDEPGVFHVYQDWTAGTWTVIMSRVLTAPTLPVAGPPTTLFPPAGKNMVDLVPGGTYPTVWANWDGAKDERNGDKYTGLWGTLILAP
jgi:DMSO reductase family type II enzyme heme b subunit